MRIAFVADCHLANHKRFGGEKVDGVNQRARRVLHAIGEAMKEAWTRGAQDFVFLGDTFDSIRPEPQLIAELQKKLRGWTGRGRHNRVHLLVGNHERAGPATRDHALGPLESLPGVFVHDAPAWMPGPGDSMMLMVPWHPGKIREWLPDVLGHLVDRAKAHRQPVGPMVLCGHFGIYDQTFPPWARESDGAIGVEQLEGLCRVLGVRYVYAGDWHKRKLWDDRQLADVSVMQVGALVPTGWDNPGGLGAGYGTLAIWEGRLGWPQMTWDEISGPRFVEVDARPDGVFELGPHQCGSPAFVRVHTTTDDAARVRAYLDKMGIEGEVVVDTDAMVAARAVRAPKTLAQALEDHVYSKAARPEIQAAVLERCRNYLGL